MGDEKVMIGTEFLRSHSLFGGISDEGIEVIKPLLKEEHFPKGEFIVKEGESGDRLYFICEGSVEILKEIKTPEGVTQGTLAVLETGDTFGEMELIDIQCRSATVRALKDVTAQSLSNKDMFTIYKSNLETFTMIILNLAREISRRLRNMDVLVGSSLYSAPEHRE